ncbi:hypothetical protein [Paenibacillus sp. SI8]|uniref:hypothetical protein n=1 Tax=unclassified Paenibacillus TaxID=185978 RepID=UPI0034661FAC
MITKYILFVETEKFNINEIKLIEAITNKEIDKIYIRIGQGAGEDEYNFILQDGYMASSADCKNSNGVSIGRYLSKTHKIRMIEKTKYKIFT